MGKWYVSYCEDCGKYFAIDEEPAFHTCPYCASDDTQGTGEVIVGEVQGDSD